MLLPSPAPAVWLLIIRACLRSPGTTDQPLVVTNNEYVGYSGAGSLTQNGSNSAANLFVGYLDGSNGTYTLNSGTASFTGNAYLGGSVSRPGGRATLAINGGYFTTGGSLNIGMFGNLTQAGGTLAVNTINIAGYGYLSQSGGTLAVNTINQTGGTASFTLAGGLQLAASPDMAQTYNLSGGTATAATVSIGGSTAGPGGLGVLNVSGSGTVSTPGTITVWNSQGSQLNLSGGTIAASSLNVQQPSQFNWTGGNLVINGTAGLIVDSVAVATRRAVAFVRSQRLTHRQRHRVRRLLWHRQYHSVRRYQQRQHLQSRIPLSRLSAQLHRVLHSERRQPGSYQCTQRLRRIRGLRRSGEFHPKRRHQQRYAQQSHSRLPGRFHWHLWVGGGIASVGGGVYLAAPCQPRRPGRPHGQQHGLSYGHGHIEGVEHAGTQINLSGGSITAKALDLSANSSLLNWTGGTLNLTSTGTGTGSLVIDSTATPSVGASMSVGPNQTLAVAGAVNVGLTGSGSLTQTGGAIRSLATQISATTERVSLPKAAARSPSPAPAALLTGVKTSGTIMMEPSTRRAEQPPSQIRDRCSSAARRASIT